MRLRIFICTILALSLIGGYSQAEIDPDRIVGIWLLDEGKGDVAEDASENGRKGTITRAEWAKGKVDGALEIKKGGTVTIPLGKGIIEDKVTFTLWINFTDIGGQQNYFSIWDQSNNRYVPYKNGGNLLQSWTNTWDVASGVTVKDGTWYHVANVYDGDNCTIYINGEEKVSQKVPKFQLQDQDQTAWLATDRGTGFLSATIMDEVGLFNDGLTEDEVQDIMNDGIYHTAFAVEPSGKLPVLWGRLRSHF
ncbi:LamG domain-containing protein [Candidatus Poribacteria bacterium]|nr:LamG domain-containing protein [Candidatus Poribacteria bacterium]